MKLMFYTKVDCPLCEKAKKIMMELQEELSFTIEEVDIYQDDDLLEKYQIMIPVVEVDRQLIGYGILKKAEIRKRLLEKIR